LILTSSNSDLDTLDLFISKGPTSSAFTCLANLATAPLASSLIVCNSFGLKATFSIASFSN
jgi:hypothetical protein